MSDSEIGWFAGGILVGWGSFILFWYIYDALTGNGER